MKSKSENKKHLIFRNLILFLTILVCIFIAVLAWFSSLTEATASGLTVKSTTGEGLEIAFEDVDTAYSTQGITLENTHELPLITSNGVYKSATGGTDGLNFFLPMLDRSVGQPLKDNGTWAVKRTAEAGRDYIEADVYFRSKEHLTVSLGGDSAAEPATETGVDIPNKSPFGPFSKNNIAGASRVGFYDASDNLKFIWAPNSTYHLSQGGNYTEIQSEEISSGDTGFSNSDPDVTFGLTGLADSGYRLWEGHTDSNQNPLNAYPQERKIYQKEDGTYVAAVDVPANTQVDHAVLVTKTNGSLNVDTTYSGKQAHDCSIWYPDHIENVGTWVGAYFDGSKNISYSSPSIDNSWSKLVVSADPATTFFADVDRFQLLISCEFDSSGNVNLLKVIGFVFYNSSDPTTMLDGSGEYGAGKQKNYKYTLDTTKSMLITGVSDGTRYGLAVSNNSLTTKSVCSASTTQIPYVSSEFLFQPVAGSAANTYKLMHITTGKYLVIDSGGSLALSANEAEFTLSVGANGPLLSMSDHYIGFAGGKITAVTDSNTAISIFQGNAYTFTSSGEAQISYFCLEIGGSAEKSLARATAAVTSIDDLSTTPIVDNLSYISNVPIVTLTKDETSGYYKGHIKVRIWIEGTDREAKTPLQGGKFKTTLSFIGAKVDETASS